jgi:hypothetical protein
MRESFDHGPVLSDAEYERRIVRLYEDMPAKPSKEFDAHIRRRELDLQIDHRLGCLFPPERRDALWEAQQRVESRRLRLAIVSLTRAVLPRNLGRGASRLAGFAVDEYAKVLSPEELQRFVAPGDGAKPLSAVEPRA